MNVKDVTFKTVAKSIANTVSDVLANSDFISRTIGMNNSYEDIMFIVQALGREPISLLGKDYAFIYDHVRRNYMQGKDIPSKNFEYCNKFTFYKEVPTVRFADPYNDPMNLLDRWKSSFSTLDTSIGQTTLHYSESDDEHTNNKAISNQSDLENANPGTAHGSIESYQPNLPYCDLVGKTNSNFNHGKYETLIARFHTNIESSKNQNDPTQSANSKQYGQSHGRNLLKITPDNPNGYENPYCRVWTYHHQYNQIKRQIRPFDDAFSQEKLQERESVGGGVGFRTIESKTYEFEGGSKRLDRYGVLNYNNGTVNIAPTAKIKDYFEHKQSDYQKNIIETKKCMFSIENLAWRDDKVRRDEFDAYGLSPEQKGPLGGRIMWFPPYNLKFNESVNVNWNPNQFIGRGEKVYTYTDTERKGTLSFTLLIDHPSILDYWTGHERNGMKNNGMQLDPKDIGGVDNTQNQENTLLRFFAGCDILTAKPQEYRRREIKPEITLEPSKPKEDKPQEPEVARTTKHKICAVLYYPNNYSGVDDLPFGKNPYVNAVHYLMNGIGAQKYVNDNKDAEDIPTTISIAPSRDGANHGGYEIGSNISIVTNALSTDSSKRRKTYSDTTSSAIKAQYLTDSDGEPPLVVKYGDNEYTLAKIVGNEAMTYAETNKKLWYRKRWYYRVDKVYENDKLTNPISYIDTKCENLNGKGYEKGRSTTGSINIPKEGGESDFHLISFASLFKALEGNENKVIGGEDVNEDDVRLVREICDYQNNGIKIKSINFRGHASAAGRGTSNTTLSNNRARTFKAWMASKGFPNPEDGSEPKILDPIRQDGSKNNIDNGDANSLLAKIWRSASVMIEYEKTEVINASEAEPIKNKNGVTNIKIEIKDKNSSSNNILDAYDWLHNTPEGKAVLGSHPELGMKDRFGMGLGGALSWKDIEKATGKDYTSTTSWDYVNTSQNEDIGIKSSTVKRYDNEGEFFEALSDKDPFLHHLITDKIKYFDPAYHSISPEGFNARLTFLHQCTRQGSTVGNADSAVASTAYNLAFGRPPVCVLRVGDFYYTKIIIDSIQINYDSPQWDMNPEGIGMMPMFADINISFAFLGGSDLGGPIARLQNAVSFNYYANASVYDNRAEKVEYDPEGSGKEIKFKGYNYPNMYVGDRLTEGRKSDEGKMDGIEPDEF